ncbi:MAG: serine/threonine protein kinase [Candidatus Obscuribacterales bacterium]|nr:serine/threonine protein kinase [Candidatus Obscuribacterales bacterium]
MLESQSISSQQAESQQAEEQPAGLADPALAELESGFRFIRRLGLGSASTVYLAEHLALDRLVALKILNRSKTANTSASQRFEREARALSRLKHPGFVDIHDLGITSDGFLFIVMEYAEGVSLKSYLADNGPIEPERAVSLFAELLDALEFAHEHGVVHRDIKPANIILTKTWNGQEIAKLVDFGVAWQEFEGGEIQRLTRTGKLIGTPGYLSPEQIHGASTDARSDIYSIGCVIYEALSGKPAFATGNLMTTLTRQLESEPESLRLLCPALNQNLIETVHACLSRTIDQRPETAKELKERLSQTAKKKHSGVALAMGKSILSGALFFLAGSGLSWCAFNSTYRSVVERMSSGAETAGLDTKKIDTKESGMKKIDSAKIDTTEGAETASAEAKVVIDLARAEITRSTSTSKMAAQIYDRRFADAMAENRSSTEKLACAVFSMLPILIGQDFVEAQKHYFKIEPLIKKKIESRSYDDLDGLFASYILVQYANLQIREAIDMDRSKAAEVMKTARLFLEQAVVLAKPRGEVDSGGILGSAYTGLGVIHAFNRDLEQARRRYKLAFDWRFKTQGDDRYSTLESLKLLVRTSIRLCDRSVPGDSHDSKQIYLKTAQEALDQVLPAYKKTDTDYEEVMKLRAELARARAK